MCSPGHGNQVLMPVEKIFHQTDRYHHPVRSLFYYWEYYIVWIQFFPSVAGLHPTCFKSSGIICKVNTHSHEPIGVYITDVLLVNAGDKIHGIYSKSHLSV